MKRILSIILILYVSFCGEIKAQDSLHISNLQAIVITPKPPFSDNSNKTYTLVVNFSIDKPDSTSGISIMVGNDKDNSGIKNQSITTVKHGTVVCMHNQDTNAEIFRFYGKSTKYELVLSEASLNQLKYVTVYAKHKNNNYSQRAYFKLR